MDGEMQVRLVDISARRRCALCKQGADPRLIDEIGARLSEVLATSPVRDVDKNLRALLASFFATPEKR